MNKLEKDTVVKEEEIELINGKWKKTTYESGKVKLKKFDKEFKIWITQTFPY